MTHREYCESQGFQFISVAGGMFDLRRDGTPTVKRAHLGRLTDSEEGFAAAAAAVRAYVAAEAAPAEDLLAATPALDGRLDEPPLAAEALMREVTEPDAPFDEDAPSEAQKPDAEPESATDDQTDT